MKSNENEFSIPDKCPQCGGDLIERSGKYGRFLGCSNFPECRYTFDLSGNTTDIKCPDCGKNLRFRSSTYGRFLSCSGYHDCKFAYNPKFKEKKEIYCPNCGKPLEIQTIEDKKYLVCKGYPKCEFKLEWVDVDTTEQAILSEQTGKKQIYPNCPKCGSELVKRSSKYGNFLGCSAYPDCNFAFNPEFEDRENISCPQCGKPMLVRTGKFGKFVGCSGYPECKYSFDLRK
jgi:DNA topoisomerase-3